MLRYLTATEVATLYRRPLGSVYRMASADRWRRADNRRPTLYNATDVDASMHRGPLSATTGVVLIKKACVECGHPYPCRTAARLRQVIEESR